MKELHKLITKDIFDCLSEEDAGRLRELRAELHIDDEAYRQMKKMISQFGGNKGPKMSKKMRRMMQQNPEMAQKMMGMTGGGKNNPFGF